MEFYRDFSEGHLSQICFIFYSKGNTALHEAVTLGPPGLKVVEALLQ